MVLAWGLQGLYVDGEISISLFQNCYSQMTFLPQM